LRDLATVIAAHPKTSFGDRLLHEYLQSSHFSLIVATAFAVCRKHRFEYDETLRQLKVADQLAGTPNALWIRACLREFAILHDPVVDKTIERLALLPGNAGAIVSATLRRRLTVLQAKSSGMNAEKRRIHFLLALQAGQQDDWKTQIDEIAAVLTGADPFSFVVQVQKADVKKPRDIGKEITMRVDRLNMMFWHNEILRDGLGDYDKAIRGFRALAKDFKGTKYLSLDANENSFSTSTDLWSKNQIALTQFRSGKKRIACRFWTDLAWKHANVYIQGYEGIDSYCEFGLKMLGQYCEDRALNLIESRASKFRRSTPSCRLLWSEYKMSLRLDNNKI